MRKAFIALTGLLGLAVVVQFYFAALGAFTAPPGGSSFALHDATGKMIIPLIALLVLVAAALARAPGRLIGLSAVLLGLVILQMLIVDIGHALPGNSDDRTNVTGQIVLGLHGLNALAIMAVTGIVHRRSRQLAKS